MLLLQEENGGERGDDYGDDSIASPDNLGWGCVSRYVEASISSLSGTNDKKNHHPPIREINVNGAAVQSTKIDMRYV